MTELEKISKLAAKAAMAIGNDFNKGFWTDDMDHRAAKHIEKVLIEAIVTTEPVKAEPCGIGGMAKTTCPWCENGFSFEYESTWTEHKCGRGCDCLTQCGDVYAYEAERKGGTSWSGRAYAECIRIHDGVLSCRGGACWDRVIHIPASAGRRDCNPRRVPNRTDGVRP